SQIPMAAYTWQRFPDHNGLHAVTFENWPALAAQHAANGFSAIKVSMTAYEPQDHIDLVHRIREAVGPEIMIRIDDHGTWNYWEPNWRLLERYEAADVSVPDIGLGPWGLWRLARLAKFMGMHVTVHSNFELCLQLSFRSALVSALIYEPESAGLYMGTAPRVCHAIDNETIQVSDDVIRGGQFDWTGGHLKLFTTQ